MDELGVEASEEPETIINHQENANVVKETHDRKRRRKVKKEDEKNLNEDHLAQDEGPLKDEGNDKPNDSIKKEESLRVTRDVLGTMEKYYSDHKQYYVTLLKCFAAVGYTVMMIVALHRHFDRAHPLLQIWIVVVIYKAGAFIRDHFSLTIALCCAPCKYLCSVKANWFKHGFVLLLIAGQVSWCMLDEATEARQFISVGGYFLILFLIFVTSKHRRKVKWRPVMWGLLLQYVLAVIILRAQKGYKPFVENAKFLQTFIGYVNDGSKFVFGSSYQDHFFAFSILPGLIYLSAVFSILYYYGVLQWLIWKLSWIMEFSLKASAVETVVIVGNIFASMVEAPMLIQPYIDELTTSELFTVMTSGLGSISGSVVGLFLGLGVNPIYLVSSIFMAAPCALAVSKLSYPETQKSRFSTYFELKLKPSSDESLVAAILSGTFRGIPLVLNIGASALVFLAFLSAMEGVLRWCGELVDYSQLHFEDVLAYVFLPVALLLGVESTYVKKVAHIIATKIFRNVYEAYAKLQILRNNRDNGTIPMIDPATGELNWVDERTEAIVTFAICGFTTFTSIALLLSALSALIPQRRDEVTRLSCRAFFSGLSVSFLNACIAGFLYVQLPIVCDNMLSTTNWTHTEPSRLYECCFRAMGNASSSNDSIACSCCKYDWKTTDYVLDCTNLTCNK